MHSFSYLVKYGAGKYLSASRAINFILTYLKQPEYEALIREAHTVLMQQNAKVAWLTGLEAMTQVKPLMPKESDGLPILATQEIYGLRAGKLFLKTEVIKQLFSNDGKFKKNNEYGRRKVAFVQCGGQKIHFKFYPEMPLVEEAVRCLARQIFLNGIVPETEVFRFFDDKKRPYPVLLSQHVEGENLQEIIKVPNKTKNMDALLDHCSFSELILFTFLYNPEDGKPDNYIFSPFINSHGKPAYRIVSIDNDHAFVEPVLLQNNHRVMQVKTILYCLSQMQLPIHPLARDNFIKLDPKTIMSDWLLLLDSTQGTCDQLFKENDRKRLFFEEDKENPIITRVPLKKGIVPKIYEKFVRLKALLQENPDITHLELLKKVIPLLGIAHEQAFKRAVSKDENTPGARFHFLFSRQYSTIVAERFGTLITSKHILASAKIPDVAMYSSSSNDCSPQVALNELIDARSEESSVDLVISSLQNGDLKLFKRLHFDKTRSLILEKVALSKLSAAVRKDLLTYLGQVQIQYLDLSDCRDFNQKTLTTILENSSEIETLNVSNCTQLSETFMMEVAKQGETIERLDLSGLNWKKIGLDKGGFIKLPNLRRLWIKDATQLTSIRLNAPFLQSLHIENASKLVELMIIGNQLDSLIIKNSSLPLKYREILVGQSPKILKKPLRYISDMPLTKEQLFRWCCAYDQEIWTIENIQFISDKTATFKSADTHLPNSVFNKFIQHATALTSFELKGAPYINYLAMGKLIKTCPGLKQIICNDYYNQAAIKKSNKMQLSTQPQDICCYPNQILFGALANKTIELVDLNVGKVTQVLKGNDNAITAPTALTLFSSNLVSGHYDGTINVWNIAKGEIIISLRGHSSRILTLKFMSQYNRLISASDDKTLKFWDLENAICEHSLNVGQKPVSIVEVLSEDQFITGSRDGYLRVWDYRTKEVINTIQVSRSSVYAIAEIEKNIVATAAGDGAIKLWNITTGHCIATLLGHKGAVLSLQVLQAGHLLASGGVDSKICIWDLLTNECIYELTEHKGNIIKLYLNELGQLVSVDNLGMIQTWEFAQLIFDLEALKLTEKPFVLEFSPETLQIMVKYTDIAIFKQCLNFVMARFSKANIACVIDETKNFGLLAMNGDAYQWVESFFDSINARFKKTKYTTAWLPNFNQASSTAVAMKDSVESDLQLTLKP